MLWFSVHFVSLPGKWGFGVSFGRCRLHVDDAADVGVDARVTCSEKKRYGGFSPCSKQIAVWVFIGGRC